MYVLLYCGVCTGVRLLPPGENPTAVRNSNSNNNNNNNNNIFFHGSTAVVGVGLTAVEVSRSYSDTPHSWTSNRLVTETST
jgi:hypothetical protein